MSVVDLKSVSTTEWKQAIINHYRFLPYWWIRAMASSSSQVLADRELDRALAAETTYLLGYTSAQGNLLGFAQMRQMEWDTNHFGIEIWRLDQLGAWTEPSHQDQILDHLVQACLQTAHARGGQGMQTRVPIDNLPAIHALERANFHVMEVLTTWLFDLNRTPIPPKRNPELIRDAEPADEEPLIELARAVYTPIPDRFHVDPHLSPRASDELYAEWIRNSFSGQMADHIAVTEIDGQVVGYTTLKYLDDQGGLCNIRIGELGLGGMSPDFRGQGIVTDGVIHNLEWLRHRQADVCIVGTQGNNIPPQIVWLKIGFRPATMALTLHHWRTQCSSARTEEAI
ncbi:MAG: GNAT family N-acetyltransferase [Anaerolineae bacterium]|nr:GNAT family N-acetyltransferase [Anaerolineae bacterium]